MFGIDQTTSNDYADPAKASLQQVDERIVNPGKAFSQTVALAPNAISLLVPGPA